MQPNGDSLPCVGSRAKRSTNGCPILFVTVKDGTCKTKVAGVILFMSTSKTISDATTPKILRPTRRIWRTRVRYAFQRGFSPEVLSCEEFQEAMRLVKPDVATGRDNVPGTILRFLPETTQVRLYHAVVERLAGQEDTHVKDWAEFDVCLVPKKGDISYISRWRPTSLVPTLYKLYELCMWKSAGQRTQTSPESAIWVQIGPTMSGHCLLFVESVRKTEECGQNLFVISMDVASAFDSVRADILCLGHTHQNTIRLEPACGVFG